MHSIRTYLLQALADPAARGSAQFGDAALDGRLSVACPLSGTPPASPESTFCAPETAYACWSSRHTYSALGVEPESLARAARRRLTRE
jgi:hypothetical protein